MGCFRTKNTNLGKFWRALDVKMLIYFWPFGIFYGHLEYFMDIWNILWTFGTFYGQFYDHLVHFVLIWYIFFQFWYHVPRKIWQP
jgi:hypothetical protein